MYHCPQFIKKKLFQHLPHCWVYSESIINSRWIYSNTFMTKSVELKDPTRRMLLGPQLAAFVPLALSSLILNTSVEYQLWTSCKIYSNRTKKKKWWFSSFSSKKICISPPIKLQRDICQTFIDFHFTQISFSSLLANKGDSLYSIDNLIVTDIRKLPKDSQKSLWSQQLLFPRKPFPDWTHESISFSWLSQAIRAPSGPRIRQTHRWYSRCSRTGAGSPILSCRY